LKFFAIIKLGAVWFDAKISIGAISIQAPKNWLSIGWLPNFLPNAKKLTRFYMAEYWLANLQLQTKHM
jgi:hypothetical protein